MATDRKSTPPRRETKGAVGHRDADGRRATPAGATREAVRDILRRYRETFDRLAR